MLTIEFDSNIDPIPLISEYLKHNKCYKIVIYGDNYMRSGGMVYDTLVSLGIPEGCLGISVLSDIVGTGIRPKFLRDFYKENAEKYAATSEAVSQSAIYAVSVAKRKRTPLFRELFGDSDVKTNVFIDKVIDYIKGNENKNES